MSASVNFARGARVAWIAGPILGASVFAAFALGALDQLLVAWLVGIWCFVLAMSLILSGIFASMEYGRVMGEVAPGLQEKYRIELPLSGWGVGRVLASASEPEAKSDPRLRALASMLVASLVGPAWMMVGLTLAQALGVWR